MAVLLIGIYFGAVVLLASTVGAVSGAVQDKGWDISPWRESGFSWIGWAVIFAVALTAFYDYLRDFPAIVTALSVVLAALALVTAVVNQADMASVNRRTDTRLYNQAGLSLVQFDATPEGNAARCATIDGLRDFAPNESELRKMNLIGSYLDDAGSSLYGVVFCDSDSS